MTIKTHGENVSKTPLTKPANCRGAEDNGTWICLSLQLLWIEYQKTTEKHPHWIFQMKFSFKTLFGILIPSWPWKSWTLHLKMRGKTTKNQSPISYYSISADAQPVSLMPSTWSELPLKEVTRNFSFSCCYNISWWYFAWNGYARW